MLLRRLSLLVVPFFLGLTAATAAPAAGVRLIQTTNTIRVEINGQLFTEYHYRDVPRPFLYPIIGPTGEGMTRNYPMQDVPGEEHDHPHHRGLWFSHINANGNDVWGETPKSGKIVHDQFLELTGILPAQPSRQPLLRPRSQWLQERSSGAPSFDGEVATLRARNQWVTTNGVPFCTEERTIRFYDGSTNRIIDYEVTLIATHGPLTMGDDKDGTMAIRLAESMRLKKRVGKKLVPADGHIVNSNGVRDDDTWGKRANWCDYYGPVNGQTVGVAIFDSPENPRHPTWWHVRDYGLFAANPFGEHHFEKLADPHAGDLVIPAGKSITFKYRFYFHTGDDRAARVEENYQEYVHSAGKRARN